MKKNHEQEQGSENRIKNPVLKVIIESLQNHRVLPSKKISSQSNSLDAFIEASQEFVNLKLDAAFDPDLLESQEKEVFGSLETAFNLEKNLIKNQDAQRFNELLSKIENFLVSIPGLSVETKNSLGTIFNKIIKVAEENGVDVSNYSPYEIEEATLHQPQASIDSELEPNTDHEPEVPISNPVLEPETIPTAEPEVLPDQNTPEIAIAVPESEPVTVKPIINANLESEDYNNENNDNPIINRIQQETNKLNNKKFSGKLIPVSANELSTTNYSFEELEQILSFCQEQINGLNYTNKKDKKNNKLRSFYQNQIKIIQTILNPESESEKQTEQPITPPEIVTKTIDFGGVKKFFRSFFNKKPKSKTAGPVSPESNKTNPSVKPTKTTKPEAPLITNESPKNKPEKSWLYNQDAETQASLKLINQTIAKVGYETTASIFGFKFATDAIGLGLGKINKKLGFGHLYQRSIEKKEVAKEQNDANKIIFDLITDLSKKSIERDDLQSEKDNYNYLSAEKEQLYQQLGQERLELINQIQQYIGRKKGTGSLKYLSEEDRAGFRQQLAAIINTRKSDRYELYGYSGKHQTNQAINLYIQTKTKATTTYRDAANFVLTTAHLFLLRGAVYGGAVAIERGIKARGQTKKQDLLSDTKATYLRSQRVPKLRNISSQMQQQIIDLEISLNTHLGRLYKTNSELNSKIYNESDPQKKDDLIKERDNIHTKIRKLEDAQQKNKDKVLEKEIIKLEENLKKEKAEENNPKYIEIKQRIDLLKLYLDNRKIQKEIDSYYKNQPRTKFVEKNLFILKDILINSTKETFQELTRGKIGAQKKFQELSGTQKTIKQLQAIGAIFRTLGIASSAVSELANSTLSQNIKLNIGDISKAFQGKSGGSFSHGLNKIFQNATTSNYRQQINNYAKLLSGQTFSNLWHKLSGSATTEQLSNKVNFETPKSLTDINSVRDYLHHNLHINDADKFSFNSSGKLIKPGNPDLYYTLTNKGELIEGSFANDLLSTKFTADQETFSKFHIDHGEGGDIWLKKDGMSGDYKLNTNGNLEYYQDGQLVEFVKYKGSLDNDWQDANQSSNKNEITEEVVESKPKPARSKTEQVEIKKSIPKKVDKPEPDLTNKPARIVKKPETDVAQKKNTTIEESKKPEVAPKNENIVDLPLKEVKSTERANYEDLLKDVDEIQVQKNKLVDGAMIDESTKTFDQAEVNEIQQIIAEKQKNIISAVYQSPDILNQTNDKALSATLESALQERLNSNLAEITSPSSPENASAAVEELYTNTDVLIKSKLPQVSTEELNVFHAYKALQHGPGANYSQALSDDYFQDQVLNSKKLVLDAYTFEKNIISPSAIENLSGKTESPDVIRLNDVNGNNNYYLISKNQNNLNLVAIEKSGTGYESIPNQTIEQTQVYLQPKLQESFQYQLKTNGFAEDQLKNFTAEIKGDKIVIINEGLTAKVSTPEGSVSFSGDDGRFVITNTAGHQHLSFKHDNGSIYVLPEAKSGAKLNLSKDWQLQPDQGALKNFTGDRSNFYYKKTDAGEIVLKMGGNNAPTGDFTLKNVEIDGSVKNYLVYQQGSENYYLASGGKADLVLGQESQFVKQEALFTGINNGQITELGRQVITDKSNAIINQVIALNQSRGQNYNQEEIIKLINQELQLNKDNQLKIDNLSSEAEVFFNELRQGRGLTRSGIFQTDPINTYTKKLSDIIVKSLSK